MQNTSVDLVFFWFMVLIAFAVGMACSAWLQREERRDARDKLARASQVIDLVRSLAILHGLHLPASVLRQMRNLVGSVRG